MVACAAGRGISNFAEAMATSERSGGKIKQPVVLTDLQGKGLVRKEAFLLKAFWLLCGYKVTGPPAAKSRSTICKTALYSIEIASYLAMTGEKFFCFFSTYRGLLRSSQ
jgi:hypothetical protein